MSEFRAPATTRSATNRVRLYFWLFLGALVLNLIASFFAIPHILHGELIDPDSYMRLVRIEQGLKLGHLINVVHRDDSGVPLVIEWSRLFDAAIVALAAPLVPFLGWHRALFIGGLATGPLSMGTLCATLGFAAAPLTQRRFLWGAAIGAPLIPGIRGFGTFGIIHYHILQPALVALALGCALRAAGGYWRWGLASGIAGAFAIWLTPETMPFVLLIEAGLGSAWLFRPLGPTLPASGAGFIATLAAALVIDPPHGGILTAEVDRLSIVYLALGVAVFATTLILTGLDRLRISAPQRAGVGIAAALAAFGLWLALYPRVALGPYALMSVADMHIFFNVISEARPVHSAGEAVALLGPGVMAFAYALWRIRDTGRAWTAAATGWALLALGAAAATGMTARMMVFQQFPAAMAVGLLPVALDEATRRFAARRLRAAVTRVSLIAAVILAPTAGYAAPHLLHKHKKAQKLPSCSLRHIAPLLSPAAGRIVLTTPSIVPQLLYRTRIIGVGSLYQHGIAAYKRSWVAWRSPAATRHEPQSVAATHAKFVLFCRQHKSNPLAVGAPANSLWHLLDAGEAPHWLTEIGADKKSGFRLYRITTAGSASQRTSD